MEEQWVNNLRRKMASHQTPVPPGLWEGIEAELAKQAPAQPSFRKKTILWTSAISSLAAVVAMGFLFLNEEKNVSPSVPSLTPQIATFSTTISSEGQGSAPQLLALNSTPSPSAERVSEKSSCLVAYHTDKTPAPFPKNSSSKEAQQTVQPHNNTSEKGLSQIPKKQQVPDHSPISPKYEKQLKSAPNKKRNTRFSLQLFAGNLPQSSNRKSGYGELVTGSILPQQYRKTDNSGSVLTREIISSNLGKDIQTHKHHHLPIKVGITARYHFNEHLSLESGLTYTFLSSTLTSGTDTHHYNTHQKLQYIGVPLSINYDLWKKRHCVIYVSAGGTLEKCVRGRTQTDYILNEQQQFTPEEKVMDHPLQCSIFGSIGAQFNLSSHVGLYAEPGIAYYFDNGSSVDNIYKDQPFNAHFKLGFRISLH